MRVSPSGVGPGRSLGRAARRATLVAGAAALLLVAAVGGHLVLSGGGADDAHRQQVQRLAREARDHMNRGSLRAAARMPTAARALEPSRADLAADLARCLVAEGEVGDGVQQLEEAIRLGWTEPALLDAPELAPVEDDPRVRALRARLAR